MKTLIQATLLVVAALYMAWGLSLLLAPAAAHPLISTGPYDVVTTAMFAAALLGLMVTFIIAAYDPEREIVRASAVGLAFVGFTSAYLIFIAKAMPLATLTVGSLAVDLIGAGVLFLTEARLDLQEQDEVAVSGDRERMARGHT